MQLTLVKAFRQICLMVEGGKGDFPSVKGDSEGKGESDAGLQKVLVQILHSEYNQVTYDSI